MATLVPLLIVVILFAVMVIVPGRRRARDQQTMRSSLAPGVDVVTTAGVYGRVDSIDTEQGTVDLEISDGVIVRFANQAIVRVLTPQPTATDGDHDGTEPTAESGAIQSDGASPDGFEADARPSEQATSPNPASRSEDTEHKADNPTNRGSDTAS